jgi:hypothetical protein
VVSGHTDEFESFKSADVELELRLDPFDGFANSISSATGYTVSINGGDPSPSSLPPSRTST